MEAYVCCRVITRTEGCGVVPSTHPKPFRKKNNWKNLDPVFLRYLYSVQFQAVDAMKNRLKITLSIICYIRSISENEVGGCKMGISSLAHRSGFMGVRLRLSSARASFRGGQPLIVLSLGVEEEVNVRF